MMWTLVGLLLIVRADLANLVGISSILMLYCFVFKFAYREQLLSLLFYIYSPTVVWIQLLMNLHSRVIGQLHIRLGDYPCIHSRPRRIQPFNSDATRFNKI